MHSLGIADCQTPVHTIHMPSPGKNTSLLLAGVQSSIVPQKHGSCDVWSGELDPPLFGQVKLPLNRLKGVNDLLTADGNLELP